jgi:hypothetical protein
MKLKPSEYWRRQCKATLQFDPISAKLIDDIGIETMVSSKYIEEQFVGLSTKSSIRSPARTPPNSTACSIDRSPPTHSLPRLRGMVREVGPGVPPALFSLLLQRKNSDEIAVRRGTVSAHRLRPSRPLAAPDSKDR